MGLRMKKRVFYGLVAFTFIMLVLICRLAFLQLAGGVTSKMTVGKEVSELAVRQREERIQLDSGRGRFVDESGRLLTSKVVWTPVFFPVKQTIPSHSVKKLADLLGTSKNKLLAYWNKLKYPSVWTEGELEHPLSLTTAQVQEISKMQLPGLEALPYVTRYPEETTGRQWLGYISEQPSKIKQYNEKSASHQKLPLFWKVGVAGLEKQLDDLLLGEGPTGASYLVDAKQRPLQRDAVRLHATRNPYYPLVVRTTINLDIQEMIEQVAKSKGMQKGAIVVLDAKNGDVRAMASLPLFHPNHVDLESGSWSNRAVKEAVPGSIFKIVTAASALEAGVTEVNETFECLGQYGKYGLSCWKEEGHGRLTLAQGFAQSCNTVFARIGERLSSYQLERTAEQLGIGRTIGWTDEHFLGKGLLKVMDQEEKGTVFGQETNPNDGGVLAQSAIGQRNVRVTPLQAANLIVTLLHGGNVQAPRLVSGIYYANGTQLAELKPHTSPSNYGKVSPQTCATLLSWMRKVVTEGTGRQLLQSSWALAGKSGTAQVVRDGKRKNDQWFIGYGPVDDPKYAVAVLVQDRKPGSPHLGTGLFGEIMSRLSQLG